MIDLEKRRMRQREWYARHPHYARDSSRKWYENLKKNHPRKYREYLNLQGKRYRKHLISNPNFRSEMSQQRKLKVFTHYCNGPPKCMNPNCHTPNGETDIRCLSIDHVNGGGNAHRRKVTRISKGGESFYLWLIGNGYPSGFQVLCMNCQFIKRYENSEFGRVKSGECDIE